MRKDGLEGTHCCHMSLTCRLESVGGEGAKFSVAKRALFIALRNSDLCRPDSVNDICVSIDII